MDVRFVEPALRVPPLALAPPRVGEGAYGTLSALGHSLLQTSLDGQASGGRGDSPPRIP